ncbi:cytochrome P450 [Corynespora cassiicola Philippines]|uniref:Cytochrome P450 n=1 Tax=Corynespora cassiicola Philippines TaxID=1448308 RepID=A0A2T2NIU2_CORCC|nr:cytochrome P450 [Corynespora cassiicola Philippines]
MPSLIKLLLAAILLSWLLYVICSWYCLLQNYLVARMIGMTIRIIPRRWEFADKYRVHEEVGDVFVMVTPARIWVHLCNPEALAKVLRKEKEFPTPLKIFEMTKVFDDNLSTADGKSWKKHRRITSPAFNKQNNELVWSESILQSRDVAKHWASKREVASTDDTRTLSLHILSAARFGKFYPFQPHKNRALTSAILDNCLLLFVFGTEVIKKPWLPAKARELYKAAEKKASDENKPATNNLMTQLMRASIGDDGLSETEIYGNIFLFNFARHNITAHTLTFTVYLLATAPDIQDWVSEELEHVLGSRPTDEWSYTADFPRLKRTLALLYETIRLYSPVPIAKSTGTSNRALTAQENTYVIPANTLLIPNHIAVHTNPKFWGNDGLKFNPRRWVESKSSSIDDEIFVTPRKGVYIPRSDRVHNYPGKKFSQIEFVASLATLLKDHYIEPKPLPNEAMNQARHRVLKLVEEDTGQVLL